MTRRTTYTSRQAARQRARTRPACIMLGVTMTGLGVAILGMVSQAIANPTPLASPDQYAAVILSGLGFGMMTVTAGLLALWEARP